MTVDVDKQTVQIEGEEAVSFKDFIST